MTTINKTNQWRLEKKIELVKSGQSRVFKEWQLYGGITEEEFIEGLKWLAEDRLASFLQLMLEIKFGKTKENLGARWLQRLMKTILRLKS